MLGDALACADGPRNFENFARSRKCAGTGTGEDPGFHWSARRDRWCGVNRRHRDAIGRSVVNLRPLRDTSQIDLEPEASIVRGAPTCEARKPPQDRHRRHANLFAGRLLRNEGRSARLPRRSARRRPSPRPPPSGDLPPSSTATWRVKQISRDNSKVQPARAVGAWLLRGLIRCGHCPSATICEYCLAAPTADHRPNATSTPTARHALAQIRSYDQTADRRQAPAVTPGGKRLSRQRIANAAEQSGDTRARLLTRRARPPRRRSTLRR